MLQAPPTYRRQKGRSGDRAFVVLDGTRHYLGPYGTDESRERYVRLLAEWETESGRIGDARRDITIRELVAAFWPFAEKHYRHADGTPTSELHNYKYAVKPLVAMYGSTLVAEFGPKRLREVRNEMIKRGWCRGHINKCVGRIRQIFRWGTECEIVDANVYHALRAVRGLAKGRSDAKDHPPKRPVPDADCQATITCPPRRLLFFPVPVPDPVSNPIPPYAVSLSFLLLFSFS